MQEFLNRRFTEMTEMQMHTIHWESLSKREKEVRERLRLALPNYSSRG